MDLRDQSNWRVKKWNGDEDALIGKRGVIRMSGRDNLDIWVLNTRIATKLEMKWKARNHYDDGALFIRPWSDLDETAKALKCPRKRHMTPEQRLKNTERWKKYGLQQSGGTLKQPFGDGIHPEPTNAPLEVK